MLGWRASSINSWKSRVLSSGGLQGWGWWGLAGHQRSYWGICCVHRLGGCFW